MSTIFRCLIVFLLGIHKGLKGAIVFDTAENKAQARSELTTIIRDLPGTLKFPKIKKGGDNREGLTLENNSQVLFKSAGIKKSKSSGTLGRSVGFALAHCSEMCSWDNDEGVASVQGVIVRHKSRSLVPVGARLAVSINGTRYGARRARTPCTVSAYF